MEKGLFRQESIDQVNSPEQIRDYLRVTSPRLWMVIVAVAALIAGFLAYASEADQEITVPVKVQVENVQIEGEKLIIAGFEISSEEKDSYSTGMAVRFAGVEGTIQYFVDTDNMTCATVWVENPDVEVPDGEYDATVVVETSTPLSTLLE